MKPADFGLSPWPNPNLGIAEPAGQPDNGDNQLVLGYLKEPSAQPNSKPPDSLEISNVEPEFPLPRRGLSNPAQGNAEPKRGYPG